MVRSLEAAFNFYYAFPQQVYDKKPFAALKEDPVFKKVTGQVDVSKLSRDEGWTTDLDLRHNNGGTKQRYPELLRTIISHTTNLGSRLYVLISRHVYSACANFVTDLERLATPVFVGEPTSGFGNQHGDSRYFFLPYSGIGCQLTGVNSVFGYPLDQRRSMQPDIPVQLTAKDWRAGKDPVLNVVLQDLKRPARAPLPAFP